MSWATSNRRASLPSDWRTIRARILHRDPTCTLGYDCCTVRSVEVDHIGEAHDHRDHMLRGVCSPCHKRRTNEQAQAARIPRTRPQPAHPGRLA